MLAGSFSLKTRIVWSLTEIESSATWMVPGKIPKLLSYLSRCALVFGFVRSLMATTSLLSTYRSFLARKVIRTMRPDRGRHGRNLDNFRPRDAPGTAPIEWLAIRLE